MHLHWFDLLIVAVYVGGTIAAGILARSAIKGISDFLVAGRTLRTHMAVATMVSTGLGLVTVMYAAQKGFSGGFAAFHIGLIQGLMVLIVGLTGFVIVPLRKTGVLTIPEFYAKRFGPKTRILGGALLALSGILNMGLFLRAGALFVQGITGLTSSTHLNIIMTLMLGLVLAYTMLGGMLSVVLTDYIQFVMLSLGIFVATALGISKLGWGNIVETVVSAKGEAGVNPFHGEGFGIGYVLFMAFIGISGAVAWQPNAMRASAAKDTSTAKRMFAWGSIGFLIRNLIPAFWGICAFVFIRNMPKLQNAFFPPEGGVAVDSLMAMPIFLNQILPIGVLGLMTAAMLAAFMSTHDSYLLSWSAVIVQDIIAPLGGEQLTARKRIFLTRITILVIGVFLLVWGLWFPLGQDLWDYMAVTGAIYLVGALVVLVGGFYWKRTSSTGAIAAMIAGFIPVCGLGPVRKALKITIDAPWLCLGALALAIVAMVVFSLACPDKNDGEGSEQ